MRLERHVVPCTKLLYWTCESVHQMNRFIFCFVHALQHNHDEIHTATSEYTFTFLSLITESLFPQELVTRLTQQPHNLHFNFPSIQNVFSSIAVARWNMDYTNEV